MSEPEAGAIKRTSSLNIWGSLKGLPREVWILAAASLVNRAGTMVLPGLVLAVYGAGSIIAAPIGGPDAFYHNGREERGTGCRVTPVPRRIQSAFTILTCRSG